MGVRELFVESGPRALIAEASPPGRRRFRHVGTEPSAAVATRCVEVRTLQTGAGLGRKQLARGGDALHSGVTLLLYLALPQCSEAPVAPATGTEEQDIRPVLADHSFHQSIRCLPSTTGGSARWRSLAFRTLQSG